MGQSGSHDRRHERRTHKKPEKIIRDKSTSTYEEKEPSRRLKTSISVEKKEQETSAIETSILSRSSDGEKESKRIYCSNDEKESKCICCPNDEKKSSECLTISSDVTLTDTSQYTIITNTSSTDVKITLPIPKTTTMKTIYLSDSSVGDIQVIVNSGETYDLDKNNKFIQLVYIPCTNKWILVSNNNISSTTLNPWTQLQAISGTTGEGIGSSISLSGDGNTLAVGAVGLIGETLVYSRSSSSSLFTFQQRLVGTGYINEPNQGRSVALSYDGNLLAVGGSGDDTNKGAVWIFVRTSGVWTQTDKLVGTGAIGNAEQGQSVSLTSDGVTFFLAVGGFTDNSGAGAVWIWNLVGGVWTQTNKLVGTGAIGKAEQGISVSLSGSAYHLAVGGHNDNSQVGATWIFERDFTTNTWSQQAKLVGSNAIGHSQQGISVSLSNDGYHLAVGGSSDDSQTGAVWIFVFDGTTWFQQAKLIGDGAIGNSNQGISVSLSDNGNILAIGGYGDNSGVGSTWIWNRTWTQTSGVWTQQAKLIGDIGRAQGYSVSLSNDGTSLAVGAPTGDGAAIIFERN